MGAVTVANKVQGVKDNRKVVEADVTFSASYATGGDTLALGLLGLKGLTEVVVPSHHLVTKKAVADASARVGHSVQLAGTSTAPLLKLYATAGTEVANATNNGAVVQRLRFLGF